MSLNQAAMSDGLTTEKIKERIIENLRRGALKGEESGVPVHLQAAHFTGGNGGSGLGFLESILWKVGIRSAGLIKRIPILNYISEKVYHRFVMKQTRTPVSSEGNGGRLEEENMKIDTMWNYDVFLRMIEREGFKGKVKKFIFKAIGFYAWWQVRVNRELLNQIDVLYQNDASIRGLATLAYDRVQGLQNSLNSSTDRIRITIQELSDNIRHLRDVNRETMSGFRTSLDSASRMTNDLFEKMETFKMEFAYLDRKLSALNQELKKHGSLKGEDLIRDLPKITLDEIRYLSFENKYRGSREDIKKRQKQYLEFVLKAKDNAKGDFVLDVGCGRGEFLELLAENSIPIKGIDTNEGMVEVCRNRSLDVDRKDALEFLNSLPDNSLIGLTAFQVAEHLPVEYLVDFIKTAFHKINDRGVLILETVNPYSLLAMKYFWMDLTHVRPLPPDTLKFLVDTAGFRDIEIKFMSPVPEDLRLTGGDRNTRVLNDLLFGDQDYAVIGWK